MPFPVERCLWCSRLVRVTAAPAWIVACADHVFDADALSKALYAVKWRERSLSIEMAWAEAELVRAMGVPATYLGFNAPMGVTNPRFLELEAVRRYKDKTAPSWEQQIKNCEAWVAPEDEWKEFT